MNEFDVKKFYGFSLNNDPALTTTTRNFEFKYARPQHLERAIQKVQHNESTAQRNRKKDIFNQLCKANKIPGATDVNRPYQRDIDIETHVSRGDSSGRVRTLSGTEINQLIEKVRSYSDLRLKNSSDTYAKDKDITKSMKPPSVLKNILRPSINEFPRAGSIGNIGQYPNAGQNHTIDKDLNYDAEVFCSDPTSEDKLLCNPFDISHEPLFEMHTIHLQHARRDHSTVNKLPDVPEEDELLTSKAVMPTIIEEFWQAQPKWVEIHEKPAKEEAHFSETKMLLDSEPSMAQVHLQHSPNGNDDNRQPTNVTYTKHSYELQLPLQISTPEMMLTNQQPPPSFLNMESAYALTSYEDNPSTFYVEDSDLEYEMMGRPEYTKLCGPRPNTEQLTNNSNDSGGLAEFIELEPKIPCMDLSFLKNVSPMRYSDMTDDHEEDQESTEPKDLMKVIIKSRSKNSISTLKDIELPICDCKDVEAISAKPKENTVEELKPSPRKKLSSCTDTSPIKEKTPKTPRSTGERSTSNTPRHKKNRRHQISNISSKDVRAIKDIILTKSIEDLKIEKIGIFAKMKKTQERIIETLDKLRISLLELYVPDSHHEKAKRQKNAFEFSVRFSRNFLYPLKGMIEDLRLVSVEQLCSALSNEATKRVLSIFVLIQQSLQTYYKQLRYFLLDQVPQKLNTLIELASTTINICLEKQVFDKNDAIIECLQERCSKFLGFLENMHEERFLTAHDNYRKAFHKTASNYNLKMFMNHLNMYEPKLVPKKYYNSRQKPKQRRVLQSSSTTTKVKSNTAIVTAPKTSEMVITTKLDSDHISTHINELETSSGLLHCTKKKPADKPFPSGNSKDLPSINKVFIEALQKVTKDQVRQVMQPIMQAIGSVLEKKNVSKTIDELLNAFSKNLISLAEGEQTKRNNSEQYSGNSDKVHNVIEDSKAAKQTERQRSRHHHANIESTKRDDPAATFFGNVVPAPDTVICDIDVDDDDDDDNYYDDDEFEQGDDSENADHDENKVLDLTESTEPIAPTELTELNRDRNKYTDQRNNKRSEVSSNESVVFDNFSESGSDFESFEGTSSQVGVEIAVKPDKNKLNEVEQGHLQQYIQEQQLEQQYHQQYQYNKKEQQRKKEKELKLQLDTVGQVKQNKQKEQQQLLQQIQQSEQRHHKGLRERAENYDTHVQQQEKLLQQQAYEEQLQVRRLKKLNDSQPKNKDSLEKVIKKSHDLEKRLQSQLEDHQRYINVQQQQSDLHQKQFKEQLTLEDEEQQFSKKENHKQQQQQKKQQQKIIHKPPQKPMTRKQLQLQANIQTRGAVTSRSSTRVSSLRLLSSRPSPPLTSSRSRVTSGAKNISMRKPDLQGENVKFLKKRRNPMNSPPPAPSATPLNSARTPRQTTTRSKSNDDGNQILETSMMRPSCSKGMFFNSLNSGKSSYRGGCVSDASQSQMVKIFAKPKSDAIEMTVPLAQAFHKQDGEKSKDEQQLPKSSRAFTKKSAEILPNHDLIEALTNCLLNFNSAKKRVMKNIARDDETSQLEEEVQGADCAGSLALHIGESPYESKKFKNAQQLIQKNKQTISQKGIFKNACSEEPYKCQQETSVDEDYHNKCLESKTHKNAVNDNNKSAACGLWNTNFESNAQKKDLHIEKLIAERDRFQRLCSKNRFYSNPNFNQPWNVFSKIAATLSNDIVGMIEKDFSIGVSKFVQDFLDNETRI